MRYKGIKNKRNCEVACFYLRTALFGFGYSRRCFYLCDAFMNSRLITKYLCLIYPCLPC